MKNTERWKHQYNNTGCIINIETHSTFRGESRRAMKMVVMDLSGAESNLDTERIETREKKNPKHHQKNPKQTKPKHNNKNNQTNTKQNPTKTQATEKPQKSLSDTLVSCCY